MISVIIPTLNTPAALDLCLKSAIIGQDLINDIVVVLDGDFDTNKHVLEKYKNFIRPIILSKNMGTCKATNIGVYESKNRNILIVNDDNVFPKNWDTILLEHDIKNSVIAPNQIEPYNSIFRQFDIQDLGRDPNTFDLENFWKYEQTLRNSKVDETGSTFPVYVDKFNYLRCGGFDSDYPSPSGFVADWEFFMKCEMNGLKMLRSYKLLFYHFVSVTAKSSEQISKSKKYEKDSHVYFSYKWGSPAQHDPSNNSKLLRIL